WTRAALHLAGRPASMPWRVSLRDRGSPVRILSWSENRMCRLPTSLALACAGILLPTVAFSATYNVGPGRQYTQLSTLVDSVDLGPGDIVLVDGGTTYNGNIVVRSGDAGAAGNPVTFRWNRTVGATR